MGDQARRTVKGHVYRTGGDFQKAWVPLGGSQLLDISFYHDVPRNIYRVICMQNEEAIINSTFAPDMQLIKTSSKFAQWLDQVTSLTYGIGFEDEESLNKFEGYFEEMRWRSGHDQLSSGLQLLNNTPQVEAVTDKSTFEELRYENDRLKVALAQSCCNVKVWERELTCLHETNHRLRGAIEESMVNVEKWNKQLRCLSQENNLLKTKVMDISIHNHESCISRKLKDVGCRIYNAENVLKSRDREIGRLKGMMERYTSVEECKMREITERLSAAELLLLAKDREMEDLKGKVCEVGPRLKEAEKLLLLRDKEMEIFKMKLRKYEELDMSCKPYRCSECSNNKRHVNFCNNTHNTVGDCDGSMLANHALRDFNQSERCICNQSKRCICKQSNQSQRGILCKPEGVRQLQKKMKDLFDLELG